MRRVKLLVAAAVVTTLAAAPAQGAGELPVLEGKGADDGQVEFAITVDAKVKKGAVTGGIPFVIMRNAKFDCKFQGGPSGRMDYTWGSVPNDDAAKIEKNGKFKMVAENEASGHVLTRYTLTGKAKAKGKQLTLTGTFQAELSEGGLEFGGCVTEPEGFKLKGKL